MKIKGNLPALAGAALGGTAGYFLFFWITRQGYYGLIIPGALLGIGAGLFKPDGKWVAVVCGIAAVILGLVCEWQFAPFIKDKSFSYFITHLHQLKPVTMIMIALGGLIGFWSARRK